MKESMNQKTTYKKLILKSIIVTLLITLAIAFIYAHVMKKKPSKPWPKSMLKNHSIGFWNTLFCDVKRMGQTRFREYYKTSQ